MLSNVITNRTVKPFIQAHDFYPGFKLEEECFSNAIIKDMNNNEGGGRSKKKSKSDLDQEPMSWPRPKTTTETGYEIFLEQVLNQKTGQFYPQKDKGNHAVPKTGATQYYTDITRIKRVDGSEYLYTKSTVYAYNSLGDEITHFISKPEIWTKTNFNYKTEFNDKTKELEKVLQGPSGNELVYTLPFNKDNLKELYNKRQNDFVNFTVKDEITGKAFQVKDVTGNLTKSYELFRDQPFDYLFGAEYIPREIKAELRQEAVAQGIIHGGAGDFNQPSSTATAAKNTYQ